MPGADDKSSSAPTSIEGCVKELIKNFWKAEKALEGSAVMAGRSVLAGLPEGKTMLKKASGEIADKECTDQARPRLAVTSL